MSCVVVDTIMLCLYVMLVGGVREVCVDLTLRFDSYQQGGFDWDN